MKKHLFILFIASILTGAFQAQAVGYRGFVDFTAGGASTSLHPYEDHSYAYYDANLGKYITKRSFKKSDNHAMMIDWGFTTSHGLQIARNFFVGIGVGVNFMSYPKNETYLDMGMMVGQYEGGIYNSSYYIWNLRYFVHVRWDGFGLFGIQSKLSPFVELKAGYTQNMSNLFVRVFDTKTNWEGNAYNSKGFNDSFFFRPSIGVRLRLTSKLGLNFGLYCEPFSKLRVKPLNVEDWYGYSDSGEYGHINAQVQIPSFDIKYFPFGVNIGLDF